MLINNSKEKKRKRQIYLMLRLKNHATVENKKIKHLPILKARKEPTGEQRIPKPFIDVKISSIFADFFVDKIIETVYAY